MPLLIVHACTQVVFTNLKGQKGPGRAFVRKDFFWEELPATDVVNWVAYAMEHVKLATKTNGKGLAGAWAASKQAAQSVMTILKEECAQEGWAEAEQYKTRHTLWWVDGLFDFERLKLPAPGAGFDEVLKAVLAAFTPHCKDTFNTFNAFNYIDFDFPISRDVDFDGFEVCRSLTTACTRTDNWHAGTSCTCVQEVVRRNLHCSKCSAVGH